MVAFKPADSSMAIAGALLAQYPPGNERRR